MWIINLIKMERKNILVFGSSSSGKSSFIRFVDFYSVKRYFKIDQHLAWHFEYNCACLSSPPPFLSSQIITPFLIQWSPPIRKDGCNCGIFILYSSSIVEFLLFSCINIYQGIYIFDSDMVWPMQLMIIKG